jgi:peptide/nickel transport system substrate-binding protein
MDKAKSELAQCHYDPTQQDLEISWIGEVPLEERFALLMQSNWAELGFKSHIVRYPFLVYTQSVGKPETTPHVSQLFYNARTPDPDSLLYNAYSSRSVGNYVSAEWLQNPDVDALLDRGRSTLDTAEREKIYRQLVQVINGLQPSIFGYEIVNTYAKSNRVTIPGLQDPAQNTHIYGLNLQYRTFEMK